MKNRFQNRSILGGLLSVSLLLAACGTVTPSSTAVRPAPTASAAAPTATSPAPTLVPVKIKAAVPLNLSNAPLFIAQAEGYFAEQGLEVEFITVGSSARALPSLISGELDVLAGAISVGHLNAIAHETHIRFVADKGHYETGECEAVSYAVRPDFLAQHPINGPADLKGLKINVNMATSAGYTLEKFLAQANLTIADVQTFLLDPSAELPALESGQVDMISVIEPSLSQEVKAGHVAALSGFYRSATTKQGATVIFGASLVDKNPEAGKRFMWRI
ncbi:MAG TPA: ABC transporter substrate-binding protein [Anaerolineae bacterium]|nr:ABC transporter substrate-binding protein [Anaerolineae bacterium]